MNILILQALEYQTINSKVNEVNNHLLLLNKNHYNNIEKQNHHKCNKLILGNKLVEASNR